MRTLTFEIEKAGQKFTITHKQNGYGSTELTVEGPFLYKKGDAEYDESDEPIQKVRGGLKETSVKFNSAYVLIGGKKYGGLTLNTEIVEEIEKSIKEDAQAFADRKQDREDHRRAPYVNRDQFEVFNIGCDTGLIYHKNVEAIKRALKNGAKQYDVLRGQRDGSNKYPGQMDDMIPVEFATVVDGKYVAEGYDYVYAEHYCISTEDYEKALLEITTKKEAKDNQAASELAAKFIEAKETGKPVLISKIVVSEEDSPLADDGEDDMVDICKMAMPDGTIKEMYFHNY